MKQTFEKKLCYSSINFASTLHLTLPLDSQTLLIYSAARVWSYAWYSLYAKSPVPVRIRPRPLSAHFLSPWEAGSNPIYACTFAYEMRICASCWPRPLPSFPFLCILSAAEWWKRRRTNSPRQNQEWYGQISMYSNAFVKIRMKRRKVRNRAALSVWQWNVAVFVTLRNIFTYA